jgi:transposase
MRQEHRVGDKFFVDYNGMTLPIVDASTGEGGKPRSSLGSWV